MLSKSPSVLLCSYTSFVSPFYHSPSAPAASTHGSKTSCRNPLSHLQHPQPRRYAQHAASSSHSDDPDLSWPDPVHPHQTPTPYQILRCRRSDAYTKHRFYSLVKLYHPDRCGPSSAVAQLPRSVRLERYRLLVAAHTILSDAEKRRAYDAWGDGWAGHHQMPSYNATYSWAPEQRKWPPGHDPAQNATWEDWERWYRRENNDQSGEPRAVYASNFAFVSLVFAIVTLGGVVQGTRANLMTSSVIEQRDKIHKEASTELARSKRATMSGDRNERIRTFLEHREAVLAGEDAYQRLLPPAETCGPDTVRKQ